MVGIEKEIATYKIALVASKTVELLLLRTSDIEK